MNVMVLIYAIGSIGLFSARAFLPAFVVAMLLRFGPSIPWFDSMGIFPQLTGAPAWFTSDPALVILGLLAAAEVAANKFPEVRRILASVDPFVKTAMVVLTAVGVASAVDADFVAQALAAGAGTALLTTLPAAAGTLGLSTVRGGVVTAISDADEDDLLGVQRVFSWLEDFGVVAGAFLALLLPVLVLVLVSLATAALLGVRAALGRWDEAQQIPCPSCAAPIYRAALACPSCRAATPASRRPEYRSEAAGPADLLPRQLDLLERRRCPSCASHHRGKAADPCARCGADLLRDPALASRYLERIEARLPSILSVCTVLGLVPVAGAVAGILFYRLRLVGPLRIWVPAGRSVVVRFALAMTQFILLAFQSVPLFGALMVPGMAWLAFRHYRPAFAAVASLPRPSPSGHAEESFREVAE